MTKNLIFSAIVAAIVAVAVVAWVGGNNQPLGGTSNFDDLRVDSMGIGANSNTAVSELGVTGTGTTTVALLGTKGCIQMISSTGSSTAVYIVGSGAATATVTAIVGTCK